MLTGASPVAAADGDESASQPQGATVRNIEASESPSPRAISLSAPDSPRDWFTLIGGGVLLVTIALWQGALFRRRHREHQRVMSRVASITSRRAL